MKNVQIWCDEHEKKSNETEIDNKIRDLIKNSKNYNPLRTPTETAQIINNLYNI